MRKSILLGKNGNTKEPTSIWYALIELSGQRSLRRELECSNGYPRTVDSVLLECSNGYSGTVDSVLPSFRSEFVNEREASTPKTLSDFKSMPK